MDATARVLIAFHTREGQTAKIADRVASALTSAGISVEARAIAASPRPADYDLVVVGDSIHAAHHSKVLRTYLREHADLLNAMPTALFQVSLTSANPDEAHTATAHSMVQELLDETGFTPDVVAMFAGALVYTQYGWLKSRIVRAIVKREDGDTDMSRDYQYTDWDAVDAFSKDLVALARHQQAAAFEPDIAGGGSKAATGTHTTASSHGR